MISRVKSRISSAHLLAILALFVALGSGAYAVTTAPKNSVVSRSIKNNTVKSNDVRNGSLSSVDVVQGCPTGMTKAARGLCVSTTDDVVNASLPTAQVTCANKGFRLPTRSEALLLFEETPVSPGNNVNEYWTEIQDGPEGLTYAHLNTPPGYFQEENLSTAEMEVRCVTDDA